MACESKKSLTKAHKGSESLIPLAWWSEAQMCRDTQKAVCERLQAV